jgi:DNA-directed RNA polymerase specialized sigma24 family protein
MLRDAAWLKRLATMLASDGDDANDLVQESWIAAWRRQPDVSRPMRPWLAKLSATLQG